MDESRFSYSIEGGEFGETTGLGVNINQPRRRHAGFHSKAARALVWAPLGMSVFFQFLLLGVFGRALLGGSQTWLAPCLARWFLKPARLNSLASLASLARLLRCSVR